MNYVRLMQCLKTSKPSAPTQWPVVWQLRGEGQRWFQDSCMIRSNYLSKAHCLYSIRGRSWWDQLIGEYASLNNDYVRNKVSRATEPPYSLLHRGFGQHYASCKEVTHWKRPWCWEGLGAGGEGDDRGWDGWMASLTRWTWVWVNSRRWVMDREAWSAAIHGVTRVGHNWATELNWNETKKAKPWQNYKL